MDYFSKTKKELIAELELLKAELFALKQETRFTGEKVMFELEPQKKIQIVLVDDSEIDRFIYKRSLSEQQEYLYEIIEFDNAEGALQWCAEHSPDVVLLDYYLPTMNGLEFLQQIAPVRRQKQIPVIIITGQENTNVAVELIKMGAEDYLNKSEITATSLNSTINFVLKHSKIIKEQKRQQEFQKIISDTALKIHQCVSLEQILNTTVTSIQAILKSDRVIIYQLQPDLSGIVIQEAVSEDASSIANKVISGEFFRADWLALYLQGHAFNIDDVNTELDLNDSTKELLADLQIRSKIVAPILHEGNLWGLLSAQDTKMPRYWLKSEIQLVKELAIQVAIAIQQATLVEKLQKQLKEKEIVEANLRQQAAMIDLAHEAIIARNLDSSIVFWNQGAQKTYGWTMNEVAGKVTHDIFQTQFPVSSEEILNTIFTIGYWQGELTHITKDHRQIIVESRQALMYDSQGKAIAIIETNRDITERKKLEENLFQSEERLRLTLELTEIGSWDYNLTTKESIWNNHLYRMWHVEPNSVVPSYDLWLSAIHPEDAQETEKRLFEAISTKKPYYSEYRAIKPDGSVCWHMEKAYILCDENTGEPTRILGVTFDITQRKETEIAIQQQKQTLSLFVQYVPAGIAMLDLNLHYVLASQRWVNDYNLTSIESLLGKSHHEIFPEIPQRWKDITSRCLKGAIEKCDEDLFIRADGTHQWLRWEARPWYDNNEQIAGIIIFSEEISQRKQAETALKQLNSELEQRIKESTKELILLNYHLQQQLLLKEQLQLELIEREQLLEGFFNAASSANVGTCIISKDMQLLKINEVLAKINGYPRINNIEANVETLLPDLAKVIVPLWEQVLSTKQSLTNVEISGVVPSDPGVMRDWLVSYFPIISENQKPLAVGGIIIEVTEQKKVEAALKEFQRRWGSLRDNVQLIIVELDPQGYVESANPFFFKLSEYTEAELVGKHWFGEFMVSMQENYIGSGLIKLLKQDKMLQYNHSILTKSGQERMISWTNTVVKNVNNEMIGVITIGEDITERYQLAKMKDDFISIVSHELRTPLTAMQAGLSLINEKIIDFDSPEGETTIQIITEGVDRLARLVNDILALSRLESGKIKLEKRTFAVSELLNTAVAQIIEMAKQEKITLNINAPNLEIDADFDRLLQVLINLLSNAIKFSPESSTIWLTVEQNDSPTPHLLFKVIDRGRGIPPEKLDRIFESFYQVDSSDSRAKGGTGLGLTICRNIVQQHRGKIWAESVVSQGSRFCFSIPLEKENNTRE